MTESEIIIIKDIQQTAFRAELEYIKPPATGKVPPITNQLNVFIDDRQVLKCRSRLNNTSLLDASFIPILLPSYHPFTEQIVAELQCKMLQNVVRDTPNHVRQKYLILRGREVAKKRIWKYVIFKRIEGLPVKFNVTPDLPEFRVSDDSPFTHTGIDFAGPLIATGVFNAERSEFKSYICLFTCASTRAVHLELVEALDVNEFIPCFHRSSARRGLPSILISDNVKTFKAMPWEVKILMSAKGINAQLESQGIQWRFILNQSPWQGGMWERLLHSVKRCIVKIVGRAMLSFMEISTLLVEIESVINAKPIDIPI